MKRAWILLLLVCGCFANLFAQQSPLLDYVKTQSEIKNGGCGLFTYKDVTYLICVSQVVVGSKNESTCRTVGAAKVKRDIISFINGSCITSSTELKTYETVEDSLSSTTSQLKQEYIEVIKEDVIGGINQCETLGSWFSNDSSVYYFAIYKQINQ